MGTRFICDHDSLTDRYGRLILERLDRGAGAFLGNALRRVLLSQLGGAAVTAVKIQGVLHEFAPIPGAVEDTSEVLRNLRNLDLRMSTPGPGVLRISAKGRGVITARDLEAEEGVTILNPDAHIVTLEAGAKFVAEIEVRKGVGFKQAEARDQEAGVISVDADFCPVERVGYAVRELEGGGESLSLEVTTNGDIGPADAVRKAAAILRSGLAEDRLISGDFGATNGTFVMDAKPDGHTVGSMLRWSLMSLRTQVSRHKTQDSGKTQDTGQRDLESSYEPVTFADYDIQEGGRQAFGKGLKAFSKKACLVLKVQTNGDLSPKDAFSLAVKRLSGMLDVLLSPPVKERGHPAMRRNLSVGGSGKHNGSVSFGDASSFWLAPDLLDLQRDSYERFLQREVSPQDRKVCGLEKVLSETFPIKSEGLTLDCLGYLCGRPSRSSVECVELSLTYSVPVTLRMRLTVAGADRIVEEEVPMGEIPLMTDDGTFVINGLKRAVIGQLLSSDENVYNDLSRKHVQTVGDFLYEEVTEAFARLKTVASERMAVEEPANMTPSSVLCSADPSGHSCIEPVIAALGRFFAASSFSQVAQENNVLDRLTHCRRLKQQTGGVPVDNVPEEPRVLHHTAYGRIDPLETPEGPNVGLIGTLAMHARVNEEGFIVTPYRKVEGKKVSDEVVHLSAQDEDDLTISPASVSVSSDMVSARVGDDVRLVASEGVDYVDAFKQQTLGPSTSLIPLLEHSDPNRILMGANMQRQAVPLLFAEQPLVQSGAEGKIAMDSQEVMAARRDGVVKSVTAGKIEIATDEGTDVYHLMKHRPAANTKNWVNQKPLVSSGQRVTKGQVTADGSSSEGGLLSLGRNILVAYMPWEGYNFEDAILISEKLIKEDVLTSLHIHTYRAEIRDTRYGKETFTRQPPGVEESALSHLDSDGIVRLGAWVSEGDILVGKMTPKAGALSPEDKLLNVLTEQGGRDGANYGDASLRVSRGDEGVVTRVQRLSRAKGDLLPKGIHEMVKVEITQKRRAKVGDKLSGRHGNKGTISRILPEADMPFMPDGTPVEMVLNPLGVPSRMNLGQILETHLGWAARTLGVNVISPPFDGPTPSQIKDLLEKAGLPASGMTKLCDGRTGRAVDTDITVGYQYTMKLVHMVDDKIHARSTGPYSLFTQQPTGGRAHFGGQRFGEMETWALEAYGAAYTLRELLTVKSDDVVGRRRAYESLLKGSDSTLAPFMPESLRKLILCLRGVAFDMKLHTKDGEDAISNVDDVVAVTIALASPEKIRKEWSHGVVHTETVAWENGRPAEGGIFCEKIFGPVKDWQCHCGKLSGQAYEGQICDECSVEVGPASMRNQRMGHIDLAVPVCHSWFLASRPNPISVLLDMEPDDIERIVHYEGYVVTDAKDTDLQYKQVLDKEEYKAKKREHGEEAFRADTGAIGIRELLSRVDLAELAESMDDPEKRRVVEAFRRSGVKPERMILDCLPVIPPGMRPTMHLEGGGVATLDLNELYTRVISRNSKYRELAAIGGQDAHDTARMIQEAVDSLFGNGRRSEGETGTLKSLSDLVKGKGGMFRSNLLGKRVDYSGRSVIVVGPDLKLDECGLPESMALELFKPFIVRKLLNSGVAKGISSARRMVDAGADEARDAVRDVANERLVILNRAPTLHRVGIQAFKPVLTDVSSLRLHPLVCVAFNADFDGDQMAVHIPLSTESQEEACQLMLSQKNVLSPAHGGAIVQPSLDIVLGCYYMTKGNGTDGEPEAAFENTLEVKRAYELGRIGLHDGIQIHVDGEKTDTTVGRVLFNEIIPSGLGRFVNHQIDKRSLFQLIEECYAKLGEGETVRFLNDLDDLGFKYVTRFGTSIGLETLKTIPDKDQLLEEARISDDQLRGSLTDGEISHEEALRQRFDAWADIAGRIGEAAMKSLGDMNPVLLMVASGARGRTDHLKSVIGMCGLVVRRPTGEPFDMPVTSNYMDGMSALEHFMMTTGARNGLIDVILRSGRAGYLMRKMVSASQDVIVTEEDCRTEDGITIRSLGSDQGVVRELSCRISGRTAAQDIKDPETGEIIASAGTFIDDDIARKIGDAGVQEAKVRSPLTCEASYGICAKCYGVDLATGDMAKPGAPVGVIAGAALGEPATQLTFRVSAVKFVDAGLPRLEELLEARESAQIPVDGGLMPLRDVLVQKGEEVFRSLMLDELMRLYIRYGISVNEKHFEILLSRMLSRVKITAPGDTVFYEGELVDRSRLRTENQNVGKKGKLASAEPVLIGMHRAALSTDSFLAAAAFGDTVNVLAQAAISGSRDELRGMRENLIVGKLIPAGTGFRKEA